MKRFCWVIKVTHHLISYPGGPNGTVREGKTGKAARFTAQGFRHTIAGPGDEGVGEAGSVSQGTWFMG